MHSFVIYFLCADGKWPAAFVPVAGAPIKKIGEGGGTLWVREKPSAAQGQEAAQKPTPKRRAAFGASQPAEGERTGLRSVSGGLLYIKRPQACFGFALKSPVVDFGEKNVRIFSPQLSSDFAKFTKNSILDVFSRFFL